MSAEIDIEHTEDWIEALEGHIKNFVAYEDLPSRLNIVANILICAQALEKAITSEAMIKLMQRIKYI